MREIYVRPHFKEVAHSVNVPFRSWFLGRREDLIIAKVADQSATNNAARCIMKD